MIKYCSKLQPRRVKRWSSFLVLLLVSPFLMWFIILLLGLCLCQLYNSLSPTHHSPSVRSYSGVWGTLSAESPVCHLLRKEMEPGVPEPNLHRLEWMISIYSHSYQCHLQLLMISMVALFFLAMFLMTAPPSQAAEAPRCWVLEHEPSFFFLLPIRVFPKRSIYKTWKEGEL